MSIHPMVHVAHLMVAAREGTKPKLWVCSFLIKVLGAALRMVVVL